MGCYTGVKYISRLRKLTSEQRLRHILNLPTANSGQKTLFLDLDETLIHASTDNLVRFENSVTFRYDGSFQSVRICSNVGDFFTPASLYWVSRGNLEALWNLHLHGFLQLICEGRHGFPQREEAHYHWLPISRELSSDFPRTLHQGFGKGRKSIAPSNVNCRQSGSLVWRASGQRHTNFGVQWESRRPVTILSRKISN